MFEPELPELEQEFRQSWREFAPRGYPEFLDRVQQADRLELLVRILSAELEYFYQPPTLVGQSLALTKAASMPDADDERVRPCVQLFVLSFPELSGNVENILRLSVLEYALRLRHDAIPPNCDSYLQLCPFDAQDRLIKLLELTESKLSRINVEALDGPPPSRDDSTVKELDAGHSISLDPLPYNLGCFLLIRTAGRGGMGYVYVAIDLRSAAQVAVKVMRRIDAWSVYRFIDEFSWLSQLNHRNLVRLYDAFSEGEVRYFSMELVEGTGIREWVKRARAKPETNWKRLRAMFAQLASAIHFLHSRGVIHRDIKSSNVMVAARRRVVLLDLGLAVRVSEKEQGRLSLDGEQLIGTLQYIAPEGLNGEPLTSASDWYSFGVMLYEALIDEYPPIQVALQAEKVADRFIVDRDLLQEKLREWPAELAELVVDLLEPQPTRRPSGTEILARLGDQPNLRFDGIFSGELVGRESSFEKLNAGMTELRPPNKVAAGELTLATEAHLVGEDSADSSITIIRGESGMGKTAFLQKWMKSIRQNDILLLSLRCFQQDHTPLRLLNQLVQELVRVLSAQEESIWRTLVDEFAATIAQTFPQVRQLVDLQPKQRSLQDMDAAMSAVRRDASQQALASLLRSLSKRRPVVIVVDDVQWSDSESLRMLGQLICGRGAIQGMLVLGELRDTPTVANFFGNSAGHTACSSPMRIVELERLEPQDCEMLVDRWAAQLKIEVRPSVRRDLSARSEGNPFFLQELFRTYAKFSSLEEFSDEDWLYAAKHDRRLTRLSVIPLQSENSVNAETVLQYLAVADQPLGFHQLQMVSRIAPHDLQRMLSYLISEGWVRSRGASFDTDFEMAHERYRQLFLESLPPDRLQRRYFRMARLLLGETPPPWPRIAHHYWCADKLRESAACYMEAARIATHDSAFDDALYFLERALHPAADRNPAEQYSALKLRAICLAGRGSSAAAAEAYEALREHTADAQERTMIDCLAGEQWIRSGQLDRGLELLRRALNDVGIVSLKKSRLSTVGLRIGALRAVFRALPADDVPKSASLPSFTAMEQCLNRLAAPLTFLDNELGPRLLMSLDQLSLVRGTDFDRSQVRARTGVILSFAGRRWRIPAIARMRSAERIAARSQTAGAQATVGFCKFIWSLQRGFPNRSIRLGRKALNLYGQDQRDAQWEIQFLNWCMLGCYWEANRLRELQEFTRQFRSSARERSDSMSLYWMNVNAAIASDLSEDNMESAERALETAQQAISNQSFQSPRFFFWLSRIQLATYAGQWELAQGILHEDWKKLSSSLIFGSNHYSWLALMARLRADLVAHRHQPHETRWLRDAMWAVRRLQRLGDRAFYNFGVAGELVINAARNQAAPQEKWHEVVEGLHALGHHLTAVALQWHQSRYADPENALQLQADAEQSLRDAGSVQPQRLLNIILPLL